jgi:pyridoxamine 5'-phosphate oxidase
MQADPNNASVVALAPATPDARLSLRTVLLKKYSENGFLFHSDYESRKAAGLASNPFAAMAFWWPAQERQVRIEGEIKKISPAESNAYFASRPHESQLSAWASPQSGVIEAPVTLDEIKKRFGNATIPRPENWDGYTLIPETFEFWQGRAS